MAATVVLVEETALEAVSSVLAGNEHRSSFWISAYFTAGATESTPASSSKHSTVEVTKDETSGSVTFRSFEDSDLKVKRVSDLQLEVQWPAVGITDPRRIVFPSGHLSTAVALASSSPQVVEKQASDLLCVDISPQGGLYAVGTVRGDVLVGSTQSGELLRTMTEQQGGSSTHAHLLETLQTKFFPASNGEALLSTSRDMHIKLWSTVDGTQPRTFAIRGQPLHHPPQSLSFVGSTGRNFLVAAGWKVFLYECGSGQLVHEFHMPHDDPVLQVLSVSYKTDAIEQDDSTSKDQLLEFGTWGTAVLAVHESRVTLWDAYTKEHITTTPRLLPAGSDITAVATMGETVLATTSAGEVVSWSFDSLLSSSSSPAPLHYRKISPWPLTAITSVSATTFAVLTTNSPILVSLTGLEPLSYLAGFDSSAATALTASSHSSSRLYVAGKAGRLLSYKF